MTHTNKFVTKQQKLKERKREKETKISMSMLLFKGYICHKHNMIDKNIKYQLNDKILRKRQFRQFFIRNYRINMTKCLYFNSYGPQIFILRIKNIRL